MKNKTVIGLNLAYYMRALLGAIIGFVCLLLPYTAKDGKLLNQFSALFTVFGAEQVPGFAIVLCLTVILTTLSFAAGLIGYAKTSVKLVKCWQVLQALATALYTVLMFGSKGMLESAGVYHDFLNKNLSVGYWCGLFAAYFTLVSIMRLTQTNPGYIVLTILGVIWLFPILWIVLTAFRAEQGYYVGYFFPKRLTFENFINLFTNQSVLPFGRWYVNTLIVAVCGCIINTMIILGVAFTLSRTRFRGRKGFMNILMIIGMFPGFMSLIAVYNILKGIGLNQSLLALIIVGAAGAAMGYHVSKGFFDTIPKAVDEAAIIDGASRMQIFFHVTLPLSKSIIIYTVLGNFLAAWSDFIFPRLLFGDKQSSYTVAVGLYWLTDFRRIDTYYTQFAAGAVVVAVPIVLLFVWLQRFYVEGLSGAVKG